MAEFQPIVISTTNTVLPYKAGQYISSTVIFCDDVAPTPNVYGAGVYIDLGGERVSLTVKGAQGIEGRQGIQGERGLQGAQGIQGNTGATGVKGDKGEQGIQGIQGEKGTTGNTGATGAVGATGAQGVKGDKGEQGIQGQQGLQGVQGATGAQGIQGQPGDISKWYSSIALMDADYSNPDIPTYAMVGVNTNSTADDGKLYYKGTTAWVYIAQLQGVQGPQGEQGPQGIQGPQGLPGATGAKGDKGEQGIQGAKGETGAVGATGAQGIQGVIGAQGIKGDKGDKGDKGEQGIQASVVDNLNSTSATSALSANQGRALKAEVDTKVGISSLDERFNYLTGEISGLNSSLSTKANTTNPQFTANGYTITPTEIGYLDRLTSNIQDQLNSKPTNVSGYSSYFRMGDGSTLYENDALKAMGSCTEYNGNGYVDLPGGLMLNFGNAQRGSDGRIKFSVAFPRACFQVVSLPQIDYAGTTNACYYVAGEFSRTGFKGGRGSTDNTYRYFAIGN